MSVLKVAAEPPATPRPGAPDATGRKQRRPPPSAWKRGGEGNRGVREDGPPELEEEAGLVTAALRGEPRRLGDAEASSSKPAPATATAASAARKPKGSRGRQRPPAQQAVAAPEQIAHFEDSLQRISGVRDVIRERQAAERELASGLASAATPRARAPPESVAPRSADGSRRGSPDTERLRSPRMEGARDLSAAFTAAGGGGGDGNRSLSDLKARVLPFSF